jgi:RNA polymerase sigma-70 factor, ECF subfamily
MSSEAVYLPETVLRSSDAPERDAVASKTVTFEPAEERTSGAAKASDELLLEQVRDGAKEALGHLFVRHARAVRAIACRILRDEAEADDLVQEVFLFLFRKATLYDPAKGSAITWILHVAYHRAFDRRRFLKSRGFYSTQQFEEAHLDVVDSKGGSLVEAQSLESILGKKSLVRFQSRLTPQQRETIQLFFFEGYTLKEIATRTGRSIVNVRSHFYRGLERMRRYVLPEKSLPK